MKHHTLSLVMPAGNIGIFTAFLCNSFGLTGPQTISITIIVMSLLFLASVTLILGISMFANATFISLEEQHRRRRAEEMLQSYGRQP